jgi:hypothetical protein
LDRGFIVAPYPSALGRLVDRKERVDTPRRVGTATIAIVAAVKVGTSH